MRRRRPRIGLAGAFVALSLAACQTTFGGKPRYPVRITGAPDASVYVIPHMQWVRLGRDKLLTQPDELAAFRRSSSTPVDVLLTGQLYVIAVKPREGHWQVQECQPPVKDEVLDFPMRAKD